MDNVKKATLITGCAGAMCLAVSYWSEPMGYLGVCLGRISGTLYCVAIDRFRAEYLAPMTVSALNTYCKSPQLLFLEMLISAVLYQVSAWRLFSRKS